MTHRINHWINGRFEPGASGAAGTVDNPATGDVTGEVAYANAEDTRAAIAAARAALPEWAGWTPLARARVMFRFKERIEANFDELAGMITAEHGKVMSDARGELTRGLEVVEFATGIPDQLKGEHSEQVGRGVDSWSAYHPVGVCAGITPFNFPAMVPMWMFPIALACGNTFVLKPSEQDPTLPNRLAELLGEAGLPDGAFNVVHGDRTPVDTLLDDERVQAVSFVGSTPVAESLYATGSANGKRVQALGGAKNHMVVMPDADTDGAADALVGAAYGSAGERCMAISVAVAVGEETGDRLVESLAPKVRALEVGPGTREGVEMGPLVSARHHERVRGYVDLGVEEGAELVVDGRDKQVPGYEGGHFMGGCLFDYVTADMRIYQEEIFGPVLVVVRVPDFASAVRLVDDHAFGNGAAIFTRDGGAAREFARHVESGMVGINVPIPVPMAFHSFGGWKRSLFGPLHMHGPEGVRFYTRMKTVTARWPKDYEAPAEFSMPTMG